MTIDEKLYRQEGIIVGLEIAISTVERTGVHGDKQGGLAALRASLETEQATYREMKKANRYDPTSRASWRNSQRFFNRISRCYRHQPALAHDDHRAAELSRSLAYFMRPRP